LKYAQDRDQSIHVLRGALAHIGRQPAAFNPQTFAVWYEHVCGINAGLSAALEARLAADQPVTDEEIDRLHDQFILARDARRALDAGVLLRKLVQEVVASAQAAGEDLSRFNLTLEQRAEALQAPIDQKAVAALVADLVGDTQQIRALTCEVTQRIGASARDYAQLEARLQHAQNLALIDPLTGLYNRRGFDEAVRNMRAASVSLEGSCLLFADLDQFKAINDRYGHVLGDRVLEAAAEVIRATIKGRDIAARLGGEEFAVLLPATDRVGAIAVAEQLRRGIEKHRVRRSDGAILATVTISVGVAQGIATDSIEQLIERADARMYAAKRGGRNRVVGDEPASSDRPPAGARLAGPFEVEERS
jgi:diguanylate cyclase